MGLYLRIDPFTYVRPSVIYKLSNNNSVQTFLHLIYIR